METFEMSQEEINRGFEHEGEPSESSGHDGAEMQPSRSNDSLGEIHVQMAPQYPNSQGQGVSNPANQAVPANQYIVRVGAAPLPQNFEVVELEPPPKSLVWTIIKRIFSALVIIFDLVLTWWNYATLKDGSDLLDNFEAVRGLFQKQSTASEAAGALDCSNDDTWLTLKLIFAIVSTVWACVQIINMVGETVLECDKLKRWDFYTDAENVGDEEKRRKLENETQRRESCFKGFQLLHGWLDTLVSVVVGDIPQAIIALLLGLNCTVDARVVLQMIIWMVVKELKNIFRRSTCKKKRRPCCHCCTDCCCVYRCDIPCYCMTWTYRPLGCLCGAMPCECEKFECCPDGCCMRSGMRCGEINVDPKWAQRLSIRLEALFVSIVFTSIVFNILIGTGNRNTYF